jgi:cation diffusion facilitator family transporter
MSEFYEAPFALGHDHVFLGPGHEKNERKTWAVIVLCTLMMATEIIGGNLFGSLALIADGLHMSTHAGAMLIAALAYTYARKHAHDPRFVFGTGKLGDLAGFTSAIILAMIALLIGYESAVRLLSPVPIAFHEAIPIAVVGLLVNVASAWLLSGHEHGHHHGNYGHAAHDKHEHDHAGHNHAGHNHAEHSHAEHSHAEHDHDDHPPGKPHAPHHVDARDHNMRAAYVHVIADAAVSVLAIIGLLLAQSFGWLWMDPIAGLIGALVISNWAYSLIRDTGGILVDLRSDDVMAQSIRAVVANAGDRLADLHVWRLGPGHFGAVLSVCSADAQHTPAFYHALLKPQPGLSHLTVEMHATEYVKRADEV